MMFDKAPDVIFLQYHGDGDPEDDGPVDSASVTWCWHRLNEHDIEYVRSDATKRAAEIMREMAEGIRVVSMVGMQWVLQTDEDRAAKAEHDELMQLALCLDGDNNEKG